MDASIACGRGVLGHAVPARDRDSGRETPCRIRACRAAHSARSTRYEPLAFRAALARACNAAIVDVRRFDLIATSFPSLLRCIAGSTRWQRWESSFSRDARMFHGLRVTVLRQRGRLRRRKCEAHHMCIAAPALLLVRSRWWAVEDCSNDDAANDVLVVQIRAVRTIYRSLPVPAARGVAAPQYQVWPINLRNAAAPSCIASRPFQAR